MAVVNIKVTLFCPIEKVWNKVTDLNDFYWRSDIRDVKIIDENNFVEITKDGVETHFKVTEYTKHQCWSFEIENENIKGNWVGKFYSHGNNTTLDFTENIIAKKNNIQTVCCFVFEETTENIFSRLKKRT